MPPCIFGPARAPEDSRHDHYIALRPYSIADRRSADDVSRRGALRARLRRLRGPHAQALGAPFRRPRFGRTAGPRESSPQAGSLFRRRHHRRRRYRDRDPGHGVSGAGVEGAAPYPGGRPRRTAPWPSGSANPVRPARWAWPTAAIRWPSSFPAIGLSAPTARSPAMAAACTARNGCSNTKAPCRRPRENWASSPHEKLPPNSNNVL